MGYIARTCGIVVAVVAVLVSVVPPAHAGINDPNDAAPYLKDQPFPYQPMGFFGPSGLIKGVSGPTGKLAYIGQGDPHCAAVPELQPYCALTTVITTGLSNPADEEATQVVSLVAAVADNGTLIAGAGANQVTVYPYHTNTLNYDEILAAVVAAVNTLGPRGVIVIHLPEHADPTSFTGNLAALQTTLMELHTQTGVGTGKSYTVFINAGMGSEADSAMAASVYAPGSVVEQYPLCDTNDVSQAFIVSCVGALETSAYSSNASVVPPPATFSNSGGDSSMPFSAYGQNLQAVTSNGTVARYDGTAGSAMLVAAVAAHVTRLYSSSLNSPDKVIQAMLAARQSVPDPSNPTRRTKPSYPVEFPSVLVASDVVNKTDDLSALPDRAAPCQIQPARTTFAAAMETLGQILENLFGVPEAWACPSSTPTAIASFDSSGPTSLGPNELFIPDHPSDPAFHTMALKASAVGDTSFIEIKRYDRSVKQSINGQPLRSFNPNGTVIECINPVTDVVYPPNANGHCPAQAGSAVTSIFPSILFSYSPTSNPPFTSFEEGWYSAQLVTRCVTNGQVTEAADTRHFFPRYSDDPIFNGGVPMPLPISIQGSPLLVDLDGNTTREIVIGSTNTTPGATVYAWQANSTNSTPYFQSQPIPNGSIYGDIDQADLDGDGLPELIVGTGGSGASQVYIYDANISGTNVPPKGSFSPGPIKASCRGVRHLVLQDFAVCSTVNNDLYWLQWQGAPTNNLVAINVPPDKETCAAGTDTTDPLTCAYVNHPNAPGVGPQLPVQESAPLIHLQKPTLVIPPPFPGAGLTLVHRIMTAAPDSQNGMFFGTLRLGPGPYSPPALPPDAVTLLDSLKWFPADAAGPAQPGAFGFIQNATMAAFANYGWAFTVGLRVVRDTVSTGPPYQDTAVLQVVPSEIGAITWEFNQSVQNNNPKLGDWGMYPDPSPTLSECPNQSVKNCPGLNELFLYSTVAVANLIPDGKCNNLQGVFVGSKTDNVWAINSFMQDIPGYPVRTGTAVNTAPYVGTGSTGSGEPSIVDIDGDDEAEVAVKRSDGLIWIFKSNGQIKIKNELTGQYMGPIATMDTKILSGSSGPSCVNPQPLPAAVPQRQFAVADALYCNSPAFHDLEGDGTMEIVVAGKNSLEVIELGQSGIAAKPSLKDRLFAWLKSVFHAEQTAEAYPPDRFDGVQWPTDGWPQGSRGTYDWPVVGALQNVNGNRLANWCVLVEGQEQIGLPYYPPEYRFGSNPCVRNGTDTDTWDCPPPIVSLAITNANGDFDLSANPGADAQGEPIVYTVKATPDVGRHCSIPGMTQAEGDDAGEGAAAQTGGSAGSGQPPVTVTTFVRPFDTNVMSYILNLGTLTVPGTSPGEPTTGDSRQLE